MPPISETKRAEVSSIIFKEEMRQRFHTPAPEFLFNAALAPENLRIIERSKESKVFGSTRPVTVINYRYPPEEHCYAEPWEIFLSEGRGKRLFPALRKERVLTAEDLKILPVLEIESLSYFWYEKLWSGGRPDSERNPEMEFINDPEIGPFNGKVIEFVGFRNEKDKWGLTKTAWMLAIAPPEIAEDLKTNKRTILAIGDEERDILKGGEPEVLCVVSWGSHRIFVEKMSVGARWIAEGKAKTEEPVVIFNFVGPNSEAKI